MPVNMNVIVGAFIAYILVSSSSIIVIHHVDFLLEREANASAHVSNDSPLYMIVLCLVYGCGFV